MNELPMNKMTNTFRSLRMTTPALLLVATGCGASAPEDQAKVDQENVGAAHQAATTDLGCATVTHNAEIDSSGGTYTSPSSYGSAGCQFAQVVDVLPLSVVDPKDPPAGIYQSWAGPTPQNRTDCQNATVIATQYLQGSGGWVLNATRHASGVWGPPPFGGPSQCTTPTVQWLTDDGSVPEGWPFRFAVQAFTNVLPNLGGGPIVPFSMTTKNGQPPPP
jgi:hypothetical protein